jgi:hypothetical protein
MNLRLQAVYATSVPSVRVLRQTELQGAYVRIKVAYVRIKVAYMPAY